MNNVFKLVAGLRFIILILCLSVIGYEFITSVENASSAINPEVISMTPPSDLPWFNSTNSIQSVQDYLERGYKTAGFNAPPVNAINNLGYTGLVHAILIPDRNLVEQLIIHGADVNMPIAADNNNRPLHYAMQKGDQEWQNWNGENIDGCIRLLLKGNADPMLVNSPSGVPTKFNDYTQKIITGQTPLHLLEPNVMDLDIRMKIVNLLIEQVCKLHGEGAVKTFLNMQDSDGNTFMHVAAETSDAPWVQRIMNAPFLCLIDMSIKNKAGKTPIQGMIPQGVSPTQEVSDQVNVMMDQYKKECPNKKVKMCPGK